MASSGSLFSETLQSITTTKLKELSKKRATFENHREALLAALKLESDPRARLRIIIDGVKTCFLVKTSTKKIKHQQGRQGRIISGSTNDPALEVDLMNMERFLEQARYDPSLSSKLLHDWEQSLLQKLNIQSLRYQYATLYGQLVMEWLSAEQPEVPVPTSNVEMLEDYEDVAGAKRLESRAEWEKSVFEPAITDEQAIVNYLDDLFGRTSSKKEVVKAFTRLQDAVESFEATMAAPGQFTPESLRWTIAGLLTSDLLTDEKRAVLKDFNASPVILSEISDVLNMRMAGFDNWTWEGDVPIEQRRKLNGTYSIHMHEDILQAIFLQYIGVKWSVFFKGAFRKFQKHEGAWTSRKNPITITDKIRRSYFLRNKHTSPGIQSKRESIYRNNYFMAQLMDYESQATEMEDGEEEAVGFACAAGNKKKMRAQQPTVQPAPCMAGAARFCRMASSIEDSDSDDEDLYSEDEDKEHDISQATRNPMKAKQSLLHLLSTEIILNTRLHGEITCIRSEFDSWMPLLPHSTIFSVLKFFGLSLIWLDFLKKFLEAPLKFVDDGQNEESRIRRRGVPGSHVLSEVLGEVILFCLDYSVNQRTQGSQLYRLHDDFWLWSPDHQTCVTAWEAITKFSDVMGVSIDEYKTATVRIVRDNKTGSAAPIDPSLIPGNIRWGFLCLDPVTGRFKIDQDIVDHHISDLRQQLHSKTKSVFSWVQAWNTYATTFFTTNFGKPANCYGRDHVDQMLSTFERIQRELFIADKKTPSKAGSVVEYLKHTLQKRFGLTEIPDGYLFFPTDLGGLELQSPFIGLLQIRDGLIEEPSHLMENFEEAEQEAYTNAKKRFDNDKSLRRMSDEMQKVIDDPDLFMSFAEFTKYREEYKGNYPGELLEVWEALLEIPAEESIDPSTAVMNAVKTLSSSGSSSENIGNWSLMTPYWKWVTQLYGPEMMEKFGELSVVDRGELPIGMVSLFRSGRVKWQG